MSYVCQENGLVQIGSAEGHIEQKPGGTCAEKCVEMAPLREVNEEIEFGTARLWFVKHF